MTDVEQLTLMKKALEYATKRVDELPAFLRAECVLDALYCAYLEGAGIRTK